MSFLPISRSKDDVDYDFVLVTGDAYVDHPSFGAAIIARVLESNGYKVGIIAQPNWNDLNSFNVFLKPKLGFLVTSGNIDSMVNHYTVAKKRRTKDYYSPNGATNLRPDRAVIVYCNKIREKFGKVPIIIGGLEASLRRFAHFDYWSDNIRRSILLDSTADLLVYGMGENQIVEIADGLNSGLPIKELTFINGTSFKLNNLDRVYDYISLPSYQNILESKQKFLESFIIQSENTDYYTAKPLVESYKEGFIVQNPPAKPLNTMELDNIYSLHFERNYHTVYEKKGGVPAITEVKHSIINNRGCFGNCNFCAITYHQGRIVQSRSHESILKEAVLISNDDDFKGYIHDVGGPTANFRKPSCKKQGVCKDKQCLFPKPCKNLEVDHEEYFNLLEKIQNLPKIKKVFIRSGIRYDYLLEDKKADFFIKKLCENHVSGQLKVAPEHISQKVLNYMGKQNANLFNIFKAKFKKANEKLGKNQFLVPYLMSSHPGCDINDAIFLAEYLRDNNITPEQVQDFYPTPGTLSTCMYYTELCPVTKQKIYVEKSPHKKAIQRALMQYKLKQNHKLVIEGLKSANRYDLIGYNKKALVKPFDK